jgi:hypothetical protein
MLTVQLVTSDNHISIPNIHVEAVQACHSGLEGSKTDSSLAHLTKGVSNDRGVVDLQVIPDCPIEVFVYLPEGNGSRLIHRTHEALSPSQRERMVVQLSNPDELRFQGKLSDGSTGEPVIGGRIQVCRTESLEDRKSVLQEESRVLTETQSGVEGEFEGCIPPVEDVYLRVIASGYGPAYLKPLAHEHSSGDVQSIVLYRTAAVVVHLTGPGDIQLESCEVIVSAEGSALHHPANVEGLSSGVMYPGMNWVGHIKGDEAIIDDLPSHVPLQLCISMNGKSLLTANVSPSLTPGERRDCNYTLIPCRPILGLAVDQDGKGVGGIELWAERTAADSKTYFSTRDDKRGLVVDRAVTDDGGHFVFTNLPSGRWLIGPAASGNNKGSIASIGVEVQLDDSSASFIVLSVYRNLFIEGTVVDPKGTQVEGSIVEANLRGTRAISKTGPDGRFRVGPLASDEHVILARPSAGFGASDPISVRPGESGIVLSLKQSGVLRGRVIDNLTRKGVQSRIMVGREEYSDATVFHGRMLGTEMDGSFDVDNIELGSYRVCAETPDGYFGFSGRIQVSDSTGNTSVEIPVDQGARIAVDYEGVADKVSIEVVAQAMKIGPDRAVPKHVITELLCPAGAVTVSMRRENKSDVINEIHLELRAGERRQLLIQE